MRLCLASQMGNYQDFPSLIHLPCSSDLTGVPTKHTKARPSLAWHLEHTICRIQAGVFVEVGGLTLVGIRHDGAYLSCCGYPLVEVRKFLRIQKYGLSYLPYFIHSDFLHIAAKYLNRCCQNSCHPAKQSLKPPLE